MENNKWYKNWIIWLVAAIILISVITATTLGIVLTKGNKDDTTIDNIGSNAPPGISMTTLEDLGENVKYGTIEKDINYSDNARETTTITLTGHVEVTIMLGLEEDKDPFIAYIVEMDDVLATYTYEVDGTHLYREAGFEHLYLELYEQRPALFNGTEDLPEFWKTQAVYGYISDMQQHAEYISDTDIYEQTASMDYIQTSAFYWGIDNWPYGAWFEIDMIVRENTHIDTKRSDASEPDNVDSQEYNFDLTQVIASTDYTPAPGATEEQNHIIDLLHNGAWELVAHPEFLYISGNLLAHNDNYSPMTVEWLEEHQR